MSVGREYEFDKVDSRCHARLLYMIAPDAEMSATDSEPERIGIVIRNAIP